MRDYKETRWKMDKFMPDSDEALQEFDEILELTDPQEREVQMLELLNNWADEEILQRYLPEGGSLAEFAKWLAENN